MCILVLKHVKIKRKYISLNKHMYSKIYNNYLLRVFPRDFSYKNMCKKHVTQKKNHLMFIFLKKNPL